MVFSLTRDAAGDALLFRNILWKVENALQQLISVGSLSSPNRLNLFKRIDGICLHKDNRYSLQ